MPRTLFNLLVGGLFAGIAARAAEPVTVFVPPASTFLEWRFQRHFSLRFDYGHFFAGQFIEESGPGQDVDYFSTWLTFRF